MPNGGVAGPVTSETEAPGVVSAVNQLVPTSPGRTTTVLLAATPPAIDNAATTATAVPMSLLELFTMRGPQIILWIATTAMPLGQTDAHAQLAVKDGAQQPFRLVGRAAAPDLRPLRIP